MQHAKQDVTINLTPYGPKARIIIRDDGDGFAPSILARAGEPYFSTRKGSSTNMGLGLFIAQTLIENQGGQVRLRNHPKGGAEVLVTLPLAKYKEEAHIDGKDHTQDSSSDMKEESIDVQG